MFRATQRLLPESSKAKNVIGRSFGNRLRGAAALQKAGFSSSRKPTTTSSRNLSTQQVSYQQPRTIEKALSPHFTAECNDEEFVGMNGGQIFAEMMKQHDVKHIFGYPGGAILPIYDGIYANPDFDFILPRHEQGAGHMAEGYARATGMPGIVLVTSGPGATNTITPMQDALSDGVPMIVFAGQVPTSAIGSDAFQEADVLGISRPCTKWNVAVNDIADLPRIIREAFHIAMSGRPGPVLVDLPKDVTASTLNKIVSSEPALPHFRKPKNLHNERKLWKKAIDDAAEMINKAKRPVIYAGQGALGDEAHLLLRAVAEKGQLPVTTTLHGMGAFDELNPLSLHMLGMHGAAYANYSIQEADCIIAIGGRFDDRVTGNLGLFAPEAKRAAKEGRGGLIQFEIQPKNIDKVVTVDVSVVGDCTEGLARLLPKIETHQREEWHQQIAKWKKDHPFKYNPSKEGEVMKPQAVLEELNRQLAPMSEKAIITTGVGQHQMWAAQYIRWRHPRTFITSGGLGTMGFGLPAAIGAKVGCPDHTVIDIDGDGSLSMTAMEFATAAQFNIGVKCLLLNNDFQGMVRQWQDLFYDQRYSGTEMVNPDWTAFAKALHCKGLECRTMEELPDLMTEFLKDDGIPVLFTCHVDKNEHVYPMVPAGAALHEMVLEPPTK